MAFPGMDNLPAYRPRFVGRHDLNLGDQWRAHHVDEVELPEDAPVARFYALVAKGERGYVTRRKGDTAWHVVEAEYDATKPLADALADAVYAQTGGRVTGSFMSGFLECKATQHNRDFAEGLVTVRPLYFVAVDEVEDVPDESGFERRRLPMNEFANAMRQYYHELHPYLLRAIDRYLIRHAKGEI